MKNWRIFLCVGALPLMVACGNKKSDPVKEADSALTRDSKQVVSEGIDDMRAHAERLGQKVKTWSYDQKEEAVEAYGRFVTGAEAELRTLQALSLQLSGETKEKWSAGLQKAKQGKERLVEAWKDAKDASADNWIEVEKNLSSAWAETQAGLAEMKDAINKK